MGLRRELFPKKLTRTRGIERVEVDMKKRTMMVCYTFDESDLEDELEERGVFRL